VYTDSDCLLIRTARLCILTVVACLSESLACHTTKLCVLKDPSFIRTSQLPVLSNRLLKRTAQLCILSNNFSRFRLLCFSPLKTTSTLTCSEVLTAITWPESVAYIGLPSFVDIIYVFYLH
jgi:hypothetical protein